MCWINNRKTSVTEAVSEVREVRFGVRLCMTLLGIVKTWVSLVPMRIDHNGGAREPSQEVLKITQERANNDLGKGGSCRKGEQSSDSGYILKVELTDVADGPTCKTKGGIKVDSLV